MKVNSIQLSYEILLKHIDSIFINEMPCLDQAPHHAMSTAACLPATTLRHLSFLSVFSPSQVFTLLLGSANFCLPVTFIFLSQCLGIFLFFHFFFHSIKVSSASSLSLAQTLTAISLTNAAVFF